jgi:NSS family neurotransmitter:Na+ symporter
VVLVVILAIRAVTLPGAAAGLEFLFKPDLQALGDVRVWLNALTQNAFLTYAIYMKAREDIPLNAVLIGFGNNAMSLLAGIMVLCTVFAINPGARDQIVGAGNEGLTFIWMPQLFAQMPGGRFFMILFFLALSFAALTSLISMVELAARNLMDSGMSRKRAVGIVATAGLVFGTPSALSVTFLNNQDWVWGVGLMLSGLFFALGARSFGVDRLRREVVNAEGADLRVGRWWSFLVAVVIPVEALVLMIWWLWGAGAGKEASEWLDPFNSGSVGTVLAQWAVALVALLALNKWMSRKTMKDEVSP